MFVCLPLVLAACCPVAEDPIFSGPQPGEPLPPFVTVAGLKVEDNQQVDLVKSAEGRPTLIVFVHEKSRPAFGMANVLMRMVESKREKIVGGLVYLTDDPTETLNWMRQVRKHLPKQAVTGISPDGKEGPEAYGLNRNVALTVLVAKDSKVTANFALVQPSLQADAPKIFEAVAEVLGEDSVAKVSDFVPQKDQRMMRGKGKSSTDDASDRDPKIRDLLRPLIQKDATDDEVDVAAKKVVAYAAKNTAARRQIGDIARRIIEAKKLQNYGTKKCQEYLTKWSKEFKAEKPKVKADKSTRED